MRDGGRDRRPVFAARVARGIATALATALACMLAVLPAGCDKRKGGAKRIPRDRDAQAVVVVEDGVPTAETLQEREPNDDATRATPLTLGAIGRGSLDGETDVDVYRVELSAAGNLAARLGGADGVDLALELLDAVGAQLARSDRGPAGTLEGLANYPLQPGVYYLTVREFVRKRRQKQEPRTGPSAAYDLAVELVTSPAPEQEREPNDDAASAREILIGDDASGYIGWASDIDMWKLPIEGFTAQYSLDMDITGVPGVTLTLDVVDNDGALVLRRKGEADGGLSVRNLVPVTEETAPQGAAARFFYARLEAKRSNPVDSYRLHVATRLLDLEEEIEPNDEPGHATSLREDGEITEGKRTGFLTVGDVDQYRLAAGDQPVLLTVEVTPRDAANVAVTVLVGGETVAMADAGGKGNKEYLADVSIPAGKAAHVQVSGAGALGDAARYDLTWSVVAGTQQGQPPSEGAPEGPTEGPTEGPDIWDDYED
ncbi:MAG TPA: PPC domain-containing protein [Haliangium sp.]|nr:PPC domain-containing protein [Haliangium sp.]